MIENENLPAKLAAQGLSATTEKRGSLVARGMTVILSNNQEVMRKSDDVIYRQARDVYNRLTDDGLGSWIGYKEREAPLTEALITFLQLASEGYGKAYFPLSTLYSGEQSIQGDQAQTERYHKLAFDWLRANQHLSDPKIWHDLGALYVGNDIELCIHWFQKAAEVGNVGSMWGLVGAYEYHEDWENALYWQMKAAGAGHEAAQHSLEQMHVHGDLRSKISDEQVFDWYVWSAEQGNLWAQLFLAEVYRSGDVIEQDDEQAAHWYLQAAEQGEPHAQLQVGMFYWEGCGIERDYEQAEYWLEQSAEQGGSESQYQFGQFLFEKGGEEEKAVQLIQCAAEQEYGPAQYFIVKCSEFFDVSDEQCALLFDKALTWYEELAEFGDSQLRLDLALMHLDCWQASYNQSYRANRFDGLRLLDEVASEPLAIDFDTGEPSPKNDVQRRASRRLGSEYLRGKVTGHATEQGIYWLTRAVDLGDFLSCRTLGDFYLLGHADGKYAARQGHLPTQRIGPDKKAAIAWYERGSSMGEFEDAAILWQRGEMYRNGFVDRGTLGTSEVEYEKNDEKAEYWFRKSAETGDCYFQWQFGELYSEGRGVTQNLEQAAYWYSKAAEQGGWYLQDKLGWMYNEGRVVEQSDELAVYWFRKAAVEGDVDAQEALKILGIDWKK